MRTEPEHGPALVELAALAQAGGHVSAARTAYMRAISCDPRNATARIGLANLLRNEGKFDAAREQYLGALAARPAVDGPAWAAAHQGLAWVFEALADNELAAWHRDLGFTGHAIVARPYRGEGSGTRLLLLVSARNGNIPLQGWIDDRHFAVTAIYTEFYDPSAPLPPHELIVNAIGDAELCSDALVNAEAIIARSAAAAGAAPAGAAPAGTLPPTINLPSRVRETSRDGNAWRLKHLPGVVTPRMHLLSRAALRAANLEFPLLLRAPGFHTGQHFVRVERKAALAAAVATMPNREILAIEYLDARGPDGMARKYRVMFVDGIAYPLHLAISADWKVHYFTAAMAKNAAYRREEQEFLSDMPGVLGAQAMAALGAIDRALGLDYAGVDFGLDASGRVLLFEANATMAIVPPDADPIWDYRRAAIERVLHARSEMLRSRV